MAPSPGWFAWLGLFFAALDSGLLHIIDHPACAHPDIRPVLLHAVGRQERKRFTHALNHTWASCTPSTEYVLGSGLWHFRRSPSFPRRGRRHLHPKQRVTWDRRLYRRCGFAGVRLGEASHPGPDPSPSQSAMEVDEGQPALARVFCPVTGCPHADRARARGWANHVSMRHHIDAHLAGTLQGDVPQDWLQAQGRTRCLVCGLSVSVRHGVHPTCHPALRAATPQTAPQQPERRLPTFQEIQQGGTPTLRHVPHSARHLWSQTLARTLAAVVHHNDEQSWRELLMLPRCVLGVPPRGGRKHAKASAAYTLDRLHQWQHGERQSLWDSRGSLGGRHHKQPSAAEKRSLATALAREGFDRKACNALLSQGLCPQTAATTQALQALHPAQPPPTTRPLAAQPLAPVLVPEAIARALRSFPADTAAGPSGLRVQHLREACAAGSADALLQQLCGVVSLLAQGHACPAVAPSLAGASLVALPKPAGGVRPIAVGEILRRLTAKCLMEAVRADARQHFAPAQLGVAIPGGAEAAVHTARAWYDRHQGQPGKVLVKLDFKNAFNLVSRQAVLDAVTARFPALTRWVTWCYKQPSDLHFGTTTLLSAGGVQQGDPLGPLLFAGALHSLVLDLRQGPLDLVFFYLDDGVIAGDVAAVGAAVAHIQAQSAQLGLHLNLDKSEAISLGATTAALSAHLPPALVLDSSGQSRVQANFELLGAAVGDAAFIAAHTQKRTTSALDLLDAISTLDDPQVALRLLRSSGGHCRMVHNMRCTPPSAQLQGFKAFDQGVRACFSSFTGLHPTDGQWQQAARGFDQAGLGLRSAHLDGAAAYLASFGKSRELCRQLDPMLGDAELLASGHAAAALDLYNGHLPAAQKAILPTCLGQTQKQLTQALDAASWDAQVSTSSLTGRALLLSEATQGGRAFLTARPAGPLCLEPAIFLAELRHRLGMPDAADDAWCPQCNGILDRFSLHAGTCSAGGERTLRHHAVRDVIYRWAERAGLHPEREKPGLLLPQRPEDTGLGRRRPADVFVPSLAGIPTALDIAVTAPQRSESLREASGKAVAAADAYADVKADHLQTAQVCENQGVRFQPMVVESTGAWSTSASHTLRLLARATAAREGEDAASCYTHLLQELCVTARRFRGRAALRRRAELVSPTEADVTRRDAALLLATAASSS